MLVKKLLVRPGWLFRAMPENSAMYINLYVLYILLSIYVSTSLYILTTAFVYTYINVH